MKNKMKINKSQYLIEHFLFFLFSIMMPLLFFRYPHEKNIFKVFFIALFILIFIFEILKIRSKWFKPKYCTSKWITFILSFAAISIIYLSYKEEILQVLGIICPPVIVALLSFLNYRLNFKR